MAHILRSEPAWRAGIRLGVRMLVMRARRAVALGVFVLGCAGLVPIPAQAAESTYTPLELKACRKTSTDVESATWECRGAAGIRVHVAEGDARMVVSYGPSAERQSAATAWFGPPNEAGKTIEWRADRRGAKPFATILRWSLVDPERDGQRHPILVVTRLGPGTVCHVAYMDGGANPDANQLARQAADAHARGFRCDTDKARVVGRVGRGISLIQGSGH